MNVIIDRYEGDFAVVEFEDRKTVNLPKQLISAGAEEGTVLIIEINQHETEKRNQGISRLIKDIL